MKTKLINFFIVIGVICSDIYKLLRNSFTFTGNTKHKMLALMMLTMHAIEKGMSLREKKNNWGGTKALMLCAQIKKYLQTYPYDERIDVAINVLNSYKEDEYGDKSINIIKSIEELCRKYPNKIQDNVGGIKSLSKPTFQISYEQVLHFFINRSSVRDFSNVALSKEEIENVYRLVQTTPTACNRQSCSLYTFQDKNKMSGLIASQLGDQGWCNNADTLFIVTANQSYFNATYERFEPYIDGGMYAMNVVMALHAQKLASCCKMFVQYPYLERKVKVIAKIPNYERPIMFILAGHYKDEVTKSPLSHRLSTSINVY